MKTLLTWFQKKPRQWTGDYFETAQTFADSEYASALASRQRYQFAFLVQTGMCVVLLCGVLFLILKQNIQLVVVHEGESGYEWISTLKIGSQVSSSWLKTRAEIANYVTNRESYDPILYGEQTKLVRWMSARDVLESYETSQDHKSPASPVNQLGAKGYRTVRILNVLSVDKIPEEPIPGVHHENLAQVNFVVEDHLLQNTSVLKKPFTALISWRYRGVPADPELLLRNWDGFEVVKYEVQPVVEH